MHKIINIEGMTCSACSNGLEKYLNKQKGIEATVNLVMATASIDYDEKIVTEEDIARFIKEAGFKSLGERSKDGNEKAAFYFLIIFAFLSLFLMYISMFDMFKLPIPNYLNKMLFPKNYITIQIVSSVAAIIWGFDILKNGIKNIIHRMPNMDSLVGVGVIVNFLYSLYNSLFIDLDKVILEKIYFSSWVRIILFLKIGRYIDKKNKAKAIDTIKNLVTITPREARILKDNEEVIVTINEIKKGEIVISKPGEKIAVDGKIIEGETHTDESFITGESNPVDKKIGDLCLAGSINYDGYIKYEALNIGKDSSISHIVDLVVNATNTKAPIARIADTISGYFVPFIFVVAAISFILNYLFTGIVSESVESLVTVLVVACPCALGLATPLAMVVAIGTASKSGLVVKSSEVLEQLNKIDTVVFDKTGTLTKGELEIIDSDIINKFAKSEVLKILKSLEVNSNHPLAKSICKNAKNLYDASNFKEISGCGVTAKVNGKTYSAGNRKYLEKSGVKNVFIDRENEYAKKGESIVYLWNDKEAIAIFGLRDEIKPNIKNVIKELKDLDKRIIMLSGDNEFTAKVIASELSIDEVYSNISPEGKLKRIEELNKNNNVLMVGDGINDSPALKKATIGVSVSNGTDISNDASDVIMLSEDMNRLVGLFSLGKKTIRIIKENLFWALFYNVCMIPLATGLLNVKLNPMIASIAMVLSSLTVVLNSLRLKNIKSKRG